MRDEQRGALVGFREGLSSGEPRRQRPGHYHRVLLRLDRGQHACHTVKLVGLVEPLVCVTYPMVDRDDEPQRRSPQ